MAKNCPHQKLNFPKSFLVGMFLSKSFLKMKKNQQLNQSCSPSDLIECLTEKARVCAFTQDGGAM
jgi:hypothetical protein